jgi:acyl-CoA thioester hydrolase
MPTASIELELPFHDVDVTGVGWHGHVYKYFELARTALLRQVGLDLPDMIALGVRVVVVETRARHHLPLRYGERLTVEATTSVLQPALQVDYRILLPDGRVAVRGRTVLAAVTSDGSQLVRVPEVVLERLGEGP